MAGIAVDKVAINQAIYSDASRIGFDEYSWLKKRSIQWHTQLGQTPQNMQATLTSFGFSVSEANQIVQIINNIDTLVAVIEGANGTTYTARQMVPDFAAVQGVS